MLLGGRPHLLGTLTLTLTLTLTPTLTPTLTLIPTLTRPHLLGTDVAAELRTAGFVGVTCIVTGADQVKT